tara:strand:+ start:280 stop:561 length:282 start_codon:yes stop_codon:yes gene_type:complete
MSINYQAIYEEEVSPTTKQTLEQSDRFYDLSPEQQRMVEELVDAGYRQAIEDALEPEVLRDTAALAGDMGSQMYNFANMLQAYLKHIAPDEEV